MRNRFTAFIASVFMVLGIGVAIAPPASADTRYTAWIDTKVGGCNLITNSQVLTGARVRYSQSAFHAQPLGADIHHIDPSGTCWRLHPSARAIYVTLKFQTETSKLGIGRTYFVTLKTAARHGLYGGMNITNVPKLPMNQKPTVQLYRVKIDHAAGHTDDTWTVTGSEKTVFLR